MTITGLCEMLDFPAAVTDEVAGYAGSHACVSDSELKAGLLHRESRERAVKELENRIDFC